MLCEGKHLPENVKASSGCILFVFILEREERFDINLKVRVDGCELVRCPLYFHLLTQNPHPHPPTHTHTHPHGRVMNIFHWK
jgi:hypothetical protein